MYFHCSFSPHSSSLLLPRGESGTFFHTEDALAMELCSSEARTRSMKLVVVFFFPPQLGKFNYSKNLL